MRSSASSLFFIFLLLTLLLTDSTDELEKVRKALEKFKENIQYDSSKINWGTENKLCNRTGVHCDNSTESQVFVDYFQLPASSVIGKIPSNSLGKIQSLRVLSLHDNNLSGQFPKDFDNLQKLSNVYLHNNEFSGKFPSSVTKWIKLFTLDLSNNKFTGTIPSDISNLKRIQHLYLQNNSLSGRLPENFPSTLKVENFSVAYNNFSGEIPKSLARFLPSAFDGNPYLCGTPLKRPCNESDKAEPPSPSASLSSDHENKKKLSSGDTIAIAIGSAWILLISLICLGKKWSRVAKEKKTAARTGRGFGDGGEAGTSSSKDDVTGAELVLFGGGVYSFDLEHLFRASAEVLGKGSVGKTYKTVLKEGNTVVVKRLKDIDVSKETFYGVMEGLGKMKNENVVPIRAYYYSKNEKLLVCDYYPAGSLFALLHGMILVLLLCVLNLIILFIAFSNW